MTTTSPLITSCRHLTLSAFRQCLIHKEYEVLGEGTAEELADAWLSIYSEYCALLGGARLSTMLTRVRMINTLASKIQRIETLVFSCKCIQDKELTDELKEDGYLVDPEAIEEAYLQQLESILSRLGAERMRVDQMRREAEVDDKGKEPTEDDFEETLIELSRFMKYAVSDDVTVYKYCLMAKRLNDHIKTSIRNGSGQLI